MFITDQEYLAKINQWMWCVYYLFYFAALSIIIIKTVHLKNVTDIVVEQLEIRAF